MYDDVNEFFWYKDRLRLLVSDALLRDPQRLHGAYGAMRATLRGDAAIGDEGDGDKGGGVAGDGGSGGDVGDKGSGGGGGQAGAAAELSPEGAATRLSRLFTKSFCERTTWLNVVHIYYRVYLLHSLLLHLSVVLAFVGWEPTYLASISLTHAFWKTLRQVIETLPPTLAPPLSLSLTPTLTPTLTLTPTPTNQLSLGTGAVGTDEDDGEEEDMVGLNSP